MDESAGNKRKKRRNEPVRLDRSEGESREDEPARLDQNEGESREDEPATLDQNERESIEDEPARLNQDMVGAESTYDVFLSFRGYDSLGFADSLYHRLKADGINVFRDDGSLSTSEELPLSVHSSNIYIPIFSLNYARSPRCLEALALMVEHISRSAGKKEILPVFYHEECLDEKLKTISLYRDVLNVHRRRWGAEKVERWKKALVEAGNVKGWERSSYESPWELITSMIEGISLRLKIKHNYNTSELEDSQESNIMELLDLEVNDVRIVGIHGRDGIGKTTIAKIVYDEISLHFDACSFLAEIEETTQQPGGIQYLQTKLIFDIVKREYEVASAFKGVRVLKEIFRNMKVLIILDDVERGSLVKEFVGAKLDWFGSGSRIIVTSKERSVLQGFVDLGLARTYDVNPMHDDLAFKFFCRCAIRTSDELHSYVDIANKIVKAAKGLPLFLKVFGSFLHDKGQEEWIKFEDLIGQCQEDYQKILSIIYEALDQKQKQMYLNIACFPPDVDSRIASYMWHYYDPPHDVIEVLCHMSIIQKEENKIGMHSMLRCLAREIMRKGFHDPGTGVGLDIATIAQDPNMGKKGTDHPDTEEAGYEILPNTTFLSLGRANIGGKFADALLNVRWLHWQGCPRDAISILLEKNEHLVILDLSWSKVTESWGGWKRIKMERLKVLNLTGCGNLLVTPSFSCCPNLEILIFERCSRLVHLDPSINNLKRLVTLNLKFCSNLSMLAAEMDGMNALRELLIDGTSVQELPASIGKLALLQILSATNCFSLVGVPGSVCELEALLVLALDATKILELPDSIGDLCELTRLSLRDCRGLVTLPESIGKLKDSLVELDISGTVDKPGRSACLLV
ncbi:disease resistance protein RPV1-like isoform X2 [Eucalyptus grandis]|uniref:disease resistance protein RPV1-like isoform X2 n=1 Tax=Eucalyptus grandis TaxID=71139 RepID=UPI00192EB0DF|nr:disease resistance protein RPV1-like isoform X2 [Eucalyptus grandis]